MSSRPVAANLQDACCLPIAAIIQPFLPVPHEPSLTPTPPPTDLATEDIARCAGCNAYINHLCAFEPHGWICALCGLQNDYSHIANRRYLGGPDARRSLPELDPGGIVDSTSPVISSEDSRVHTHPHAHAEGGAVVEVPTIPALVALVDLTNTSNTAVEYVELVQSALLAAIEGVSPDTQFGLITFNGLVLSVYEPCVCAGGGSATSSTNEAKHSVVVRHLPLTPFDPNPSAVELADVVPIGNVLTSLEGDGKAAVVACIEHLTTDSNSNDSSNGSSSSSECVHRPFGEALQSVSRLLARAAITKSASSGIEGGEEGGANNTASITGMLGTRLMVFLGGAPNYGRGSVVSAPLPPSSSQQQAQAQQQHNAPFLMDPYFPELTAWSGVPPVMTPPPPPSSKHRHTTTNYTNSQVVEEVENSGWADLAESLADFTPIAKELNITNTKAKDAMSFRYEEAFPFYAQAGAAAAALGIVIDIYALSSTFVGLEALRPMVINSGGTLMLYNLVDSDSSDSNAPTCALPQDVYKRVSEPCAFGCMLRLRTSPELQVEGPLGNRLRQDPRFPDVFHLAVGHPHDTFALELGFINPKVGFTNSHTDASVLQLVIQYLCLVQRRHLFGTKTVLQRRQRIVTTAFGVAHSPMDAYSALNADAYLFTLIQDLNEVAAVEGIEAAKEAVVERAVEVTAAYHESVVLLEQRRSATYQWRRTMKNNTNQAPMAIDVAFKGCEAMQSLPRFWYALLRGPVFGTRLSTTATHTHPDEPCAMRVLWDTLPPPELSLSIYSQLSSWSSPDTCVFPRHSLSRAALALSRQPIYVLDAYSTIIVLYAREGLYTTPHEAGTAVPAPFPPPFTSRLRQHCAALSQARQLTPRVVVVREGGVGEAQPPEHRLFTEYLIEDEEKSAGGTFVQFLDQLKEMVQEVVLSS